MSEWTSEWMSEWVNDWVNKQVSEWMNEWWVRWFLLIHPFTDSFTHSFAEKRKMEGDKKQLDIRKTPTYTYTTPAQKREEGREGDTGKDNEIQS